MAIIPYTSISDFLKILDINDKQAYYINTTDFSVDEEQKLLNEYNGKTVITYYHYNWKKNIKRVEKGLGYFEQSGRWRPPIFYD
jgi:hypothetical protein